MLEFYPEPWTPTQKWLFWGMTFVPLLFLVGAYALVVLLLVLVRANGCANAMLSGLDAFRVWYGERIPTSLS